MQKSLISQSLIMSSLLLALCMSSGCKNGEQNVSQDSSKPENKLTVEQKIKEIDANTHMPPEAKAAAKAALLSHHK